MRDFNLSERIGKSIQWLTSDSSLQTKISKLILPLFFLVMVNDYQKQKPFEINYITKDTNGDGITDVVRIYVTDRKTKLQLAAFTDYLSTAPNAGPDGLTSEAHQPYKPQSQYVTELEQVPPPTYTNADGTLDQAEFFGPELYETGLLKEESEQVDSSMLHIRTLFRLEKMAVISYGIHLQQGRIQLNKPVEKSTVGVSQEI